MEYDPRVSKIFSVLFEVAVATPKVANAKLAAAIVYKNRIVSIGVNSLKTNPFQIRFASSSDSIYLHAETAAIKNALRQLSLRELSRASLYVCRVKSKDGTPNNFGFGLAKPCIGCTRAIIEFNISKVFYTCETGISVL